MSDTPDIMDRLKAALAPTCIHCGDVREAHGVVSGLCRGTSASNPKFYTPRPCPRTAEVTQ